MIVYSAVRLAPDWVNDEIDNGVCEPESMAAVVLVHYPVHEGWFVEFHMVDDKWEADNT